MKHDRRAKIVATVGPASALPKMLAALLRAGVDTFRLNFSHGCHDDHARVCTAIRELEHAGGRSIGILQDLQGPKIRVGAIANGRIDVTFGQRVTFVRDGGDGSALGIPLAHPEIFASVAPGQDLLIDDGKVRVRVLSIGDGTIEAHVVTGGAISNRKGVNLPGTTLDISPLTAKDRADLEFGLSLGVDWVALSFVQSAADLVEARELIGGRAGLVAKIEKPSALTQLDEIVALADAVMVARGDLGVEIPHEDVPGWQKEIVRACRQAAKPVIVATQMLDSMVAAPTPTRAETSDVATAVYDGADAVMLSAESASGQYPLESVAMMDKVIRSTEQHRLYRAIVEAVPRFEARSPAHAVAAASSELARTIDAATIVGFTSTGATVARISRERPTTPILAVTPNAATARRMCLVWGAKSVLSQDVHSYEEMVETATRLASSSGMAATADVAVIVAGTPFGQAGATNNLRVVQVP